MLGQIEKLACAKFGVCRTICVCFIAKNECARQWSEDETILCLIVLFNWFLFNVCFICGVNAFQIVGVQWDGVRAQNCVRDGNERYNWFVWWQCLKDYETIVLRLSVCLVCVAVRPSAMTLKWHNIVIAIQCHCNTTLYEGRYPLRYVAVEIWHCPSTRTTSFVTTLSVSPNSLKCNISITNCPIALKFDTRVKH